MSSRTEQFLENYKKSQPTQARRGAPEPSQEPLTALAIDGGGVRGLIPARVLAEIERLTGRPIWTSFDLISGTSTGGVLALALTAPDDKGQPRSTPSEMIDLYRNSGSTIFRRDLLRSIPGVQLLVDKYGTGGLEKELRAKLDETPLSKALTEVVITSWNLTGNSPAYFSRAEAGSDFDDVPMWRVARATSAAPSYFHPCEIIDSDEGQIDYVDGGVFANDPANVAYLALRRVSSGKLVVVSIGCGNPNPEDPRRRHFWGAVPWAGPMVHLFMTAPSELVEVELSNLRGANLDYYRLMPDLDGASPKLDDCSADNIAKLDEAADELIASSAADLGAICQKLKARPLPSA
jgi:predicted acylesterase/phospholipase RssA